MLFLAPLHLTTAAEVTVGLHKLTLQTWADALAVTCAIYIKVCTKGVTLFGILVDTIPYCGKVGAL